MELKVNHEDLRNVKNNLTKDKEDLEKEIDNLFRQLELLQDVWQGTDSKAFCDNFLYYLDHMKHIPTTFGNIAKFVDYANKGYEQEDEVFAQEMKMEASKYAR